MKRRLKEGLRGGLSARWQVCAVQGTAPEDAAPKDAAEGMRGAGMLRRKGCSGKTVVDAVKRMGRRGHRRECLGCGVSFRLIPSEHPQPRVWRKIRKADSDVQRRGDCDVSRQIRPGQLCRCRRTVTYVV